jgi:hypothetical protein
VRYDASETGADCSPDARYCELGCRHYMYPPEASIVAPVRYEASGESKNVATAAISSGPASRSIAFIDLMTA